MIVIVDATPSQKWMKAKYRNEYKYQRKIQNGKDVRKQGSHQGGT